MRTAALVGCLLLAAAGFWVSGVGFGLNHAEPQPPEFQTTALDVHADNPSVVADGEAVMLAPLGHLRVVVDDPKQMEEVARYLEGKRVLLHYRDKDDVIREWHPEPTELSPDVDRQMKEIEDGIKTLIADRDMWREFARRSEFVAWPCPKTNRHRILDPVPEDGYCLRVRTAENNWDRARGLTHKGKPILIYSDKSKAWVRP